MAARGKRTAVPGAICGGAGGMQHAARGILEVEESSSGRGESGSGQRSKRRVAYRGETLSDGRKMDGGAAERRASVV